MAVTVPTLAPADVGRLHAPDAETFDRLAADGTDPLILTGCLADWPLLRELRDTYSPDAQIAALTAMVGNRRVRYTRIQPEQHGHLGYTADGTRTNFSFTSGGKVPFARFGEALQEVLSSGAQGAVYMQSAPLTGFPELLEQVPDLPYLSAGEGYRQLWIGSGGHVVNLHFDPTHNLIAMLSGRKRVTLIPPDDMAGMYPAPLDCRLGDAIGSQVKLLEPDFARHPRARAELSKALVAEIGPGDILYIPPMWWHHVESFGLNVMINKWVLPVSSGHFTDLTANIVRGMLLFSELPVEARRRLRGEFADAVFDWAPLPALPDDAGVPPGLRSKTSRYLRETQRALEDVPPSLRRRLPALYDYYVFQADGDAALSATNPTGFKRKLAAYAAVMGAMRSTQSFFKADGRH
jgi:hypothetical protein